MKTATVTVAGVTPFSPSRALQSVKPEREDANTFDERVWREHNHTNDAGLSVVPAMMIQFSICSGAERLKRKIPGEGPAKYGALFGGGIVVKDDMVILPEVRSEDLRCQMVYAHADGKRTCGTRVWRRFPMIYPWGGEFDVAIVDDKITQIVFEDALDAAGKFCGWGRFSPRVKGRNGRFEVKKVEWFE